MVGGIREEGQGRTAEVGGRGGGGRGEEAGAWTR